MITVIGQNIPGGGGNRVGTSRELILRRHCHTHNRGTGDGHYPGQP